MDRLTPYVFFIVAILAIGMIALQDDGSWQTEEVGLLEAVLITGGVLIGAHILRRFGLRVYDRWKSRRK